MGRMRMLVNAVAVIVLGSTLALVGCGAPATPGGSTPGGGTTAGPVTPGGGTPLAPGYTKNADGSVQVIGYLQHSDLEGGFWAVYDAWPTTSDTTRQKVLAVLLPGSVDETGIARLDGQYVRARGRVGSDVSVRMAGPEVLVDAIEKLSTR